MKKLTEKEMIDWLEKNNISYANVVYTWQLEALYQLWQSIKS